MDYFRAAADRGHANLGWLNSHHTFSFGHYYDPQHMGVSVLRVINDDTVDPGAGFDTHGHRDMEIISYVLEGAIEHIDSMGNRFNVPAGEVQRMSAGSGVTHSEFNASASEKLCFLQIWIKPNVTGITPSYEQAAIAQSTALTPLVTVDGREGSLTMHQDANLYRLQLSQGQEQQLTVAARTGYLHVVRGSALIQGSTLVAGDGLGVNSHSQRNLQAMTHEFEALWFDLPQA